MELTISAKKWFRAMTSLGMEVRYFTESPLNFDFVGQPRLFDAPYD